MTTKMGGREDAKKRPIESYALFLDDDDEYRFPPDQPVRNWVIARSVAEAVAIVEQRGCPSHISFDHDLGQDAHGHELPTGLDFAKWLVNQHLDGLIDFRADWKVHSLNPVGARNIEDYLRSFKRNLEED
jgi:hypothetical protein